LKWTRRVYVDMILSENEFVFFYDPKFDYGTLSPHYDKSFTMDGKEFMNVDQFVLYMKVKYGGYNDIADVISNPCMYNPVDSREILRAASNLKCGDWDDKQMDAIAAGYYARFTQSPKLTSDLMVTYGKKLVFADPYDRKLGIGCTKNGALGNISSWGHNLTGVALMMVREKIVESINKKDAVLVMWMQNNKCTDLTHPRAAS
jgi:ribA/ribD-fused uncharacterized protein